MGTFTPKNFGGGLINMDLNHTAVTFYTPGVSTTAILRSVRVYCVDIASPFEFRIYVGTTIDSHIVLDTTLQAGVPWYYPIFCVVPPSTPVKWWVDALTTFGRLEVDGYEWT